MSRTMTRAERHNTSEIETYCFYFLIFIHSVAIKCKILNALPINMKNINYADAN